MKNNYIVYRSTYIHLFESFIAMKTNATQQGGDGQNHLTCTLSSDIWMAGK